MHCCKVGLLKGNYASLIAFSAVLLFLVPAMFVFNPSSPWSGGGGAGVGVGCGAFLPSKNSKFDICHPGNIDSL